VHVIVILDRITLSVKLYSTVAQKVFTARQSEGKYNEKDMYS